MPARDPRRAASNLLLGLAGGAAGFAAAVGTTTGAQGPFAAAGLAGLAAGAGLASRALAVDAAEDDHLVTRERLMAAYADLEDARRDAEAAREDAVGLALDIEMGWT